MSPRDSSEERTVIGNESRVSVALLAAIFAVTTAATAGGMRWASRVEWQLEQIQKELVRTGKDRWTESDMKSWAFELGTKNPSLSVPEPQHRYIRGEDD